MTIACPPRCNSWILTLLLLIPGIGWASPPGPKTPRVDVAGMEAICPSCNDYNGCTLDICDDATGTCLHLPRDCDDHKPCTADACRPASGGDGYTCTHTPLTGTACDDSLACTTNDTCTADGSCKGTVPPPDTSCDDGNPCTLSDLCDTLGICHGAPAPAGTACETPGSCFAPGTCGGNAVCSAAPLAPGTSCDDRNRCTLDDACRIAPGGSMSCQGVPRVCDDGDPCTRDACAASTGECVAATVSCDDGNPCTDNACDPATGQCVLTFAQGGCSDGNPCTTTDFCSGGNCLGSGSLDCNDNNFCSTDFCDPWRGCVYVLNPVSCGTSSDPCFTDPVCTYGNFGTTFVCQASPKPGASCGSDPCYQYVCTSHGFCVPWGPVTGSCDDHNACTASDHCEAGICTGDPVGCNDGDPCTIDSCATGGGCAHAPLCDDHDLCTQDSCSASGVCTFTPTGGPITCGVGACQRTVDDCLIPCVPGTPAPETCNGLDDNCNGVADEDTASQCNDSNLCTLDACGGAAGCTHVPGGGPPPTFYVTLSPAVLTPPDHQMVEVQAMITPFGPCSSELQIVLVSITSSEPDDAPGYGDGHTTQDIQGAVPGTADFSFQLRAERDGRGSGRIYQVTYMATAPSGQSTSVTGTVLVPRTRAIFGHPGGTPPDNRPGRETR